MKQIPWLNIIGINSSDITILPKNLIKSIKDADIVFGAKRHTSLFQNLNDNIKPLEIPFKKTYFSHTGSGTRAGRGFGSFCPFHFPLLFLSFSKPPPPPPYVQMG